LGGRLFSSLDRTRRGKVGLAEFAYAAERVEGLVSLVEFRRRLLANYPSLEQAFRELEDYCELAFSKSDEIEVGGRVITQSLTMERFMRVAVFFGLGPNQSSHFFRLMDVNHNGLLTLDEFSHALSSLPREVLLEDFRRRVLERCDSLADAFQLLGGSGHDSRVRLDRPDFVDKLLALGIAEVEAHELFAIVDVDKSQDVSLFELREALRSVATPVNLETFWRRLAEHSPKLVQAAHLRGEPAHSLALTAVADLLSPNMLALVESTRMLSPSAFDSIAAALDIPPTNAADLLSQVLASSRAAMLQLNGEECNIDLYVEDLLEQLLLWVDNPTQKHPNPAAKRRSSRRQIRDAVAPTRAQLEAFKNELMSSVRPPVTPRAARAQMTKASPPRDLIDLQAVNPGRKFILPATRWRCPAMRPVNIGGA
jgi:Ca2+-binding EF-hand superfamily protein